MGGYAVMVLLGPRDQPTQPAKESARQDMISLVVTQAVIALGLTLAFGLWVYPVLWLAPLASLTALCHLVRSFAEHAITDDEKERHSNRLITIKSNWLERGLFSPYNMNYHAEHHLVPSVPAPRLKMLQARLAERADLPPVLERRSYGAAVRRYLGSLRG
jgi:fatty acid desaturase